MHHYYTFEKSELSVSLFKSLEILIGYLKNQYDMEERTEHECCDRRHLAYTLHVPSEKLMWREERWGIFRQLAIADCVRLVRLDSKSGGSF